MHTINFEKVSHAQKKILTLLATKQSLNVCLDAICLEIEALIGDESAKASILTLKSDHLFFAAGPNIDPDYSSAIDDLKIGPSVGSCGTAAFNGEPFYAERISDSPNWEDYAELAASFNLAACWSTPIFSSKHQVLGTFAVYFDKPSKPTPKYIELIGFFTNLASLAIEKDLARKREAILTDQLKASIAGLQAFGRVIPDLAFIISEDGYYIDVFGQEADLRYKYLDNILGRKVEDVLPDDVARHTMKTIDKTLSTGEIQQYEYSLDVPIGTRVFEGKSAPLDNYLSYDLGRRHVVWLARDMTDRKLNELEIEKLAFYDALTNLPNRRLLMDRLHTTIKKVKRHNQIAALIFLDLDNFKLVNDTLGHSGGDDLLCEVAKLLQSTLRDSDTLARIGGDEFVILLESNEISHEVISTEAKRVCERILENLSEPILINDQSMVVGASLGISLIEKEGMTPDEVLGHADVAMYEAKKQGKGQLCFYKEN